MRFSLSLLALMLVVPIFGLAETGKLESIGAFADPAASESLKNALEPKGYRVQLADGSTLCEIWLRKAVAGRPKADVSGSIYSELKDSALIGVLSFPKGSTDFRGQQVKAGAYTMRYGLHPTDGNHMGISPYRDFLLLVPVSADADPDAQFKFEDLVKQSGKAVGVNHPAPLSMVPVPPQGKGTNPSLSEDEHGHLVFAAKVKTASGGELVLAFVVKGMAEQ